MKYKTLILFFVLNLSLCCFSSELIKQPDEYSCAPACSYNLIKKLCPNCDNNIQYLIKLEKTNKKGTTAYNLCNGINKYFRTQNKNVNIEYYGVKKVRKYKVSSDINFEKLKNNLNQNTQVIINIGVYTKNKDGSYTRQYGHYVNLAGIDNNTITVFDPYDKKNELTVWKIKFVSDIDFKNINDNEKYTKTNNAYIIENGINYIEPNETAFINGIIIVKE